MRVDIQKIVNRLDLPNVDALAELLGKSRAVVYRYGKSEDDPGFSEPPYSVIKKLLELGATTEELFGIDCKKTCPEFKYKADELAKIYSGVEQLAIPTPRPAGKREVTEEDVRRLIREAFEAEKK